MTPHQTAVAEALRRIAPDIDVTQIDQTGDLREEFARDYIYPMFQANAL